MLTFQILLVQTEYGDTSERTELIKKLHCHDFDWYLEKVYPEKYVPENKEGTFGLVVLYSNKHLSSKSSYV